MRTLGGVALTWCGLGWLGGGGGLLLRSAAAVAWAALLLRSFMIFHDAGHGSLFQGSPFKRLLNKAMVHVCSAVTVTPVDWNRGHALHHAHVGNTEQDTYDWSETIFHTTTQYHAMASWKRRLYACVRHPLCFFATAAPLTWYVKMRLPVEPRPGRRGNYTCLGKLENTVYLVARIWLAHRINALGVIIAGDYLAMTAGTILFHWQHVYNPGYVRGKDDWNRLDASITGSSLLRIPACLRWVTLGIEYHHIHHLRITIPGYMLRRCHEEASPELWRDVTVLGPYEMWASLTYTLWDDTRGCYTTFAAADAAAVKRAGRGGARLG